MVRRFVMLIVGLALGTLGWLIAEALFLRLPDNGGLTREAITYGHFEFFDAAGMANWKVYLTYFGFLFPVLRWWKQADPLRRKAASFGSTLGVVLWACYDFRTAFRSAGHRRGGHRRHCGARGQSLDLVQTAAGSRPLRREPNIAERIEINVENHFGSVTRTSGGLDRRHRVPAVRAHA